MTKKAKKNIKIVMICLFVAVVILFILGELSFLLGWGREKKFPVYQIGKDKGFRGDEYRIAIENDTENEHFVLRYTNVEDHRCAFDFVLYFDDYAVRANGKTTLVITDENGVEIVFENDGSGLSFCEDRTFYVSYAELEEEEKEAISENRYHLCVESKFFYP